MLLGGTEYMTALDKYVTSQGAYLDEHRVNTPICCPSRSTMLSGRYYHNNRASTPTGCMFMNTSEATNPSWEHHTFAPALKAQGYTTGYFGKYLNQMPVLCGGVGKRPPPPPKSKTLPTPPGWDHWFGMCKITYFQAWFNNNGTPMHTGVLPKDYSTSVIGNASLAWIKEVTAQKDHPPFWVGIGPHAPHLPSTPAPWYENLWPSGLHAKHTPTYNFSAPDHHWLVAMQPILNQVDAAGIDQEYTNRLRTLFSVDDIISDIAEYLMSIDEWDNTYFFYSSDHGKRKQYREWEGRQVKGQLLTMQCLDIACSCGPLSPLNFVYSLCVFCFCLVMWI